MNYLYWIAGCILGLAWLSRIVDAALGMPTIADISRSAWDRRPAANPRVSIVVPARNEEENIEPTLAQLLALDYDNFEVIAVNDRSTDRTGEIMDKIAASPAAHGRLKIIHVGELPPGWLGKTHAMWSASREATATGCCSRTPMCYSSPMPFAALSRTPNRRLPIIWCYFPASSCGPSARK